MAGRVLLAAGGTGGHMFPAQSLAEDLKSKGWDVALMTDARGQKHSGRIPADPIIEVQAASISPRKPIQALTGILKLTKGVRQAKAFIRDWKPDIVVGFGGYPAFPAMRAAQSLGLPTILHEQNAVLGRVNRVFAAKATHVVSGFDVLDPMRAQIMAAVPEAYEAPSDTINLLCVGGSLGARILSQTIPKAVALLPAELRGGIKLVQQTTEGEVETARALYAEMGVNAVCETFFSDIETHLAKAHFIIARAGARGRGRRPYLKLRSWENRHYSSRSPLRWTIIKPSMRNHWKVMELPIFCPNLNLRLNLSLISCRID